MKKEDHHALGTAISWLIFCIIVACCNACLNYSLYCCDDGYRCCDYYYYYFWIVPGP